eukprot:scaffold21505_cov28-Tisochrysis_lutea.AAC.2
MSVRTYSSTNRLGVRRGCNGKGGRREGRRWGKGVGKRGKATIELEVDYVEASVSERVGRPQSEVGAHSAQQTAQMQEKCFGWRAHQGTPVSATWLM